MIVSLHTLAQTYNLLPSQALSHASTFDLYVLDMYTRFIKYQEDVTKGQAPQPTRTKQFSQQSLKQMLENVRANPRKMNKERKSSESN